MILLTIILSALLAWKTGQSARRRKVIERLRKSYNEAYNALQQEKQKTVPRDSAGRFTKKI